MLANLDNSRIQELKDLNRESPGFLNRMFELFLESSPRELQILKRCQQQHDRTDLSAVAHRFKSSCLNLGAKSMAASLQKIESFAATINFEELESELAKIEKLLNQTKNEILSIDNNKDTPPPG